MRAFRQIGSAQIVDQASDLATLTHGVESGPNPEGTSWPLLPNQSCRIYNVGAEIYTNPAANGGKVQLSSAAIYIVLLNAALQTAKANFVVLASMNWPTPTIIGSNWGGGIAADGDPLIELFSNQLVTGKGVNGTSADNQQIAGFAIFGACDATNTDPSNSFDLHMDITAVLQFVPRG